MYGQNPAYLNERFPTEVRATAAGFCYHQGAIWGGLVGPGITYAAVNIHLRFAYPMLVASTVASFSLIFAMLLGLETRSGAQGWACDR